MRQRLHPQTHDRVLSTPCDNARVYRHDYILRLIERFGQALTALRDRLLRRTTEDVTARVEIGEIAREAGLDLGVARSLDPSMLLMWLAPSGEPDPARLWLMAELLYLEGLHPRASGESSRRADLERALAIFDRLPQDWRPTDGFATAGERVEEIRTRLSADA